MFQFQYGAIKGLKKRCKKNMELCFNSNMVRLRVNGNWSAAAQNCGFNSNMVRLRGYAKVKKASHYYVSIPIWCD